MEKNSSLIPHTVFSMLFNKHRAKPLVIDRQQGQVKYNRQATDYKLQTDGKHYQRNAGFQFRLTFSQTIPRGSFLLSFLNMTLMPFGTLPGVSSVCD